MGGDDGLIISARFFVFKERCRVHSGLWDIWLQLAWILAGFLLMAYFAVKVFPSDNEGKNSRSESALSTPPRPELITLGNYRFEIAAESSESRSKVIELYPGPSDRKAGLR